MMRNLYRYKTRIGPFFIAEHEGRYHVIFDNENLGGYATAAQPTTLPAATLPASHRVSIQRPSEFPTM